MVIIIVSLLLNILIIVAQHKNYYNYVVDIFSLCFSVSNIGPKRYQTLLNKFETVEEAWNGTKEQYYELSIKYKTFDTFNNFRKTFDIEKYITKLNKEKVVFISFLDKRYPKGLKKLENPPIGIFVKGNIGLLKPELRIGVVGTRKITTYGKSATETLVSDLVSNGVCIVSGLALGVDGTAHRTAVSNNGKTIAVLACGVDCCLPSENYSLYIDILKNKGLIVSEYPLSQTPNKGTFLARNRIIAALSDGVLVTEAANDSGSLVTAEWGLKLEKKVFAVPGQITSRMSDGSLKLLKQGAKLVTRVEDILDEFRDQRSNIKSKLKSQKFKNLTNDERKIVLLLENEPLTIDEISKKTKVDVLKTIQLIGELELKGVVKNERGKISI